VLLAVQTELAEIDTGKSEATTVEHFYIAARLPQEDLNEVASGHGQRGRDILWSSGNISQCRIRPVESPQPYCK
jgi:hypothetical protein